MEFQVHENAKPNLEFIYFETVNEVNLNDYNLLIKVHNENSYYMMSLPTGKLKSNCTLKWFTGKGKKSNKRNLKNGIDHIIYMNRDNAIWNDVENELVCLLKKSDAEFVKCH